MAAIKLEVAQDFLAEPGQRAGFILLGSFLASFLFIRTSARLMRSPKVPWWPGSVSTKGGLHIHHFVFGIVLLLLAGFLEFALAPENAWLDVLAALFGIGAGLTLDEFALWLHLDDVYWAEEGRASIDAVLVATLLAGLVVLGLSPFELANQGSAVTSIVVAVTINLLFCAITILKGKPVLGITGVFVPPVSVVGALRLASPTSPWARRRYSPEGGKLGRAQVRFERVRDRRRRARDAIGGAPSR